MMRSVFFCLYRLFSLFLFIHAYELGMKHAWLYRTNRYRTKTKLNGNDEPKTIFNTIKWEKKTKSPIKLNKFVEPCVCVYVCVVVLKVTALAIKHRLLIHLLFLALFLLLMSNISSILN